MGTGAFFTVFLATRCGDSDSESDSEPDGPKFALLLVKVARDGQIKKPKRRSGPFKQVAIAELLEVQPIIGGSSSLEP